MKKISFIIFILLFLVMFFNVNAFSTPNNLLVANRLNSPLEKSSGATHDILYVFDLEKFLRTIPTSKIKYDYLKLATALQGLVNRHEPQLYFYFEDNYLARQYGYDMDLYWQEKLREDGEYLEDYVLVSENDFFALLEKFKGYYDGFVLWDEFVPATSNVASTIAGVENLLPVRYSLGENDLYTNLLNHGFSEDMIKKNLTGMFTGSGTIPNSNTMSTGSKKNDAYIWAKEQYLDKGLTNPLLMTYSLDAYTWKRDNDKKVEYLSVSIPEKMEANELVKISITVKNTSQTTWTLENNYRLALIEYGIFEFYNDKTGNSSLVDNKDRLGLTKDVVHGEEYTIEGYLKAPSEIGYYEIAIDMVEEGVDYFNNRIYLNIEVCENLEEEVSVTEEFLLTDIKNIKTTSLGVVGAEFISSNISTTMNKEEILKVSFTLKNIGETTWNPNEYYRLGIREIDNFSLWLDENATTSNAKNNDRVNLNKNVLPGEVYTFETYLKAPENYGDYTIIFDLVIDGISWVGSNYKVNISINPREASKIVVPDTEFIYENLFNTALLNADYYIANKAFFWDLSPDDSIAPIDDRNQKIGNDYNTLKEILISQSNQAAKTTETEGFFTVGGFVPWNLKYSNSSDPNSNITNVDAEWKTIDILSTYHGQTDADAYDTVGLANASVFQSVPLSDKLKQNNDKGESNSLVYSKDVVYISIYVGDFDGSSWTSGKLPSIWELSSRYEEENDDDIPIAWPINSSLAPRIPHVYNMLYKTAGKNDYFVAGNNGVGYLNPLFLEGEYVPNGMTNFLDKWTKYNIASYKKFDLDISGYLIEGTPVNLTDTVKDAYNQISPIGVFVDKQKSEIYKGTPYVITYYLPPIHANDTNNIKRVVTRIKDDIKTKQRGQFLSFHFTKATRYQIKNIFNLIEEQESGLKYELVDPYTFFRLYNEANNK